MKKIQSGEGASDFGTVEKGGQPPLADWEKELLDQALPGAAPLHEAAVAAGGCDATPGYLQRYMQNQAIWPGPIPPIIDPSKVFPMPAPLDEKWVTDVIHDNWRASRDQSGFPHWIINAARIIVAGK